MAWKSALIKPFARRIARHIHQLSSNDAAVQAQDTVFKHLIGKGGATAFGKDHFFSKIKTYADFKAQVPIRDYEGLKDYIERVKKGEANVLWQGKPAYFAKTSGTTSGIKYIPITKESVPNHFGTARNALFNYSIETGNAAWLDGKQIFLSGSPELEELMVLKQGVYRAFLTIWCHNGCA